MGWKEKVKAVAEKGQGVAGQAKAAVDEKQSEVRASAAEREAQRQTEWQAAGILFECKSHEEGRNSTVTLYSDRIERVKDKAFGSLSRAKQDVEVIPLRSASSVQAKKDGVLYTKVTVYASGNNIDFRIRHDEAQQFRDAVTKLLLQDQGKAAHPSGTRSEPDSLDQLKKLAELKDAGVISAEEFQAKKTQLLAL